MQSICARTEFVQGSRVNPFSFIGYQVRLRLTTSLAVLLMGGEAVRRESGMGAGGGGAGRGRGEGGASLAVCFLVKKSEKQLVGAGQISPSGFLLFTYQAQGL